MITALLSETSLLAEQVQSLLAIERDAELSLAELSPAKLHYACPPVLKSLEL